MHQVLLVGAGGALGAVARYGASVMFGRLGIGGFPYATMTVNIVGSFLMGLLIGWLALFVSEMQSELRLFIAVGVLGGFTTFSAFSLDAILLFERGDAGQAMIYIGGSVLASLLALSLGLSLMRSLGA